MLDVVRGAASCCPPFEVEGGHSLANDIVHHAKWPHLCGYARQGVGLTVGHRRRRAGGVIRLFLGRRRGWG
jgi:hypothetical protein